MPLRRSPSVGVIIAAFRAGGTVERAVRSALAEPETTEVVLVDDASYDDTCDRAAAADDGSGRLQILRQPRNAGPAAARNKALSVLRSDWVCVLDSDDYFLPGRLGALLAVSRGWDLVADDLIRVTNEQPAGPPRPPRVVGPLDFVAFVEGNISRRGRHREELGFMKPLTRRAFLVENDLSYDERLRLGEDYFLYASMLARGARLLRTEPAGYVAVERADSLSGRHDIGDLRALRDCDLRLEQVGALGPRERRVLKAHYTSLDQRLQWRLMIEAVKARDLGGVLGTFTSAPVALHLLRELAEQALVRARRDRGGPRSGQEFAPEPDRPA